MRARILTVLLAPLLLAPILPVGPATAVSTPSADPSEPARLIGGEVLTLQFDGDDLDTLHPGSVLDHSPYGGHATRVNGPGIVAGPNGFGGALDTHPTNGMHARVDTLEGLRTLTQDFTLAAWVNLQGNCCWSYLFSAAASNGVQTTFWRVVGSSVDICIATAGGSLPCFGFGYNLPLNAWTHLAVVARGGDLSLLVNGETHKVLTRAPGLYTASPLGRAVVGMHYGTSESFRGFIDEFRVYNRSLTNDEVRSIRSSPYVHLNDPPVLAPIGDKAVDEDALLEFVVNATDPQGDDLAFSATGLPAGATFNETTLVFSWRPGFDQAGLHEVVFTVSDGEATDSETVTIAVGDVGRPPVLDPLGPFEASEGVALSFTATAADPDGGALSFSLEDAPAGAAIGAASGVFSWTPGFDQAGEHLFTVRVSDGALSAAQAVLVTVSGVNLPPVAHAGPDVTLPCAGPATPVTLDGSGSSDPDGDPLSYAWSLEGGASADDPAAPVLVARFRPGVGVATLAVTDGQATASDSALVRVVDEGAPRITATFPPGPGVYAGALGAPADRADALVVGSVDVSAEAEDACSPIAAIRFSVDDGTDVLDAQAPFGFTYAPEGLGVQYRTVTIVAQDAQGNLSPPVTLELAVLALAPRLA